MSERQKSKLEISLYLGYRTKSDGERVQLSDAMEKQMRCKLKAEKAKRGVFVYSSNYGPARRTENGYEPQKTKR